VAELMEIVERTSGAKAPNKIPYALAHMVGRWQRIRARLTGKEPELTDEEVRIYRREWAYSSQRAVHDLGYKITPLEEGVSRMIAWMRQAETVTRAS
jgi:nucleoside-diphosphate-sugar epimerase